MILIKKKSSGDFLINELRKYEWFEVSPGIVIHFLYNIDNTNYSGRNFSWFFKDVYYIQISNFVNSVLGVKR